MSRLTATVLAAAAISAVLVLPSAAHAQALTVDDGTGDVWTQVQDPETNEWSWVEDPVDNSDLTSTTVEHTKKTISVVGHYASLKKKSNLSPTFLTWFLLDDGRRGVVAVDLVDGKLLTQLAVQRQKGGKWNHNLKCPGLAGKWHWDTDKVTASFPRSCFDNPTWLRFHVRAGATHQDDSDYLFWTDNAQNDKFDLASFTTPVHPYSSKLKAG